MTTAQFREIIREEFAGEYFRKAVREELQPITKRLDGMDTRLSRGIADLAKGQETIGLIVNDIHGRLVKLEKDEPWKGK